MKKRIIITAAITACLALCAAERNDRRDHSTADTSGSRETGAASGNRKERIGNAGS